MYVNYAAQNSLQITAHPGHLLACIMPCIKLYLLYGMFHTFITVNDGKELPIANGVEGIEMTQVAD